MWFAWKNRFNNLLLCSLEVILTYNRIFASRLSGDSFRVQLCIGRHLISLFTFRGVIVAYQVIFAADVWLSTVFGLICLPVPVLNLLTLRSTHALVCWTRMKSFHCSCCKLTFLLVKFFRSDSLDENQLVLLKTNTLARTLTDIWLKKLRFSKFFGAFCAPGGTTIVYEDHECKVNEKACNEYNYTCCLIGCSHLFNGCLNECLKTK